MKDSLAPLCDSIANGTLVIDIKNFSNEQIAPFLPYMLTLITPDNGRRELDPIRSRIIEFPASNLFRSFFSVNSQSMDDEIQSFYNATDTTFDQKNFNLMDHREKMIYVCKECIALTKLSKNSSRNHREFEPFDQEVFHDEVACIITLVCHIWPMHINLVRLACGLLCYKNGAKLLVKVSKGDDKMKACSQEFELTLNQINLIDHILQILTELRFNSDLFVCNERDLAMFELFTLRPHCVVEYLHLLLQSENHFNLVTRILCSNLLSDEMFAISFGKILSSRANGKYVKFLMNSAERSSMIFGKIKKIADERSENMDEISVQLVLILIKLFQDREFRTSGNIKFALEMFTHLRTIHDGYLKMLVSAFIVCFVNSLNFYEANSRFAKEFFLNLRNLINQHKDDFSSFNEFVLLLAIHFQSIMEIYDTRTKYETKDQNEEAVNKLLSTALGFKIYTGYNPYSLIAKIFLENAVHERDVVEMASRISLTPKLNSHITGYLPVHCIDYLLNNRSFSKFSISIQDWLQKQILQCCAPVHPIIVSIIRKYAITCVAFDSNLSYNKKIEEKFFRDLFSRNVLTEENAVPYLLSFYFVLVYNSIANQTPQHSALLLPSSTKLYSSELLSSIPIRHLISIMDEHPDLYQHLRTRIQMFSVKTQFHLIPTIEADLRKSTNEMFHRIGMENEMFPSIEEVMYLLIPSIKVVIELPHGFKENQQKCLKAIQRLEKLSAEQLAEFYRPIAYLMYKSLDVRELPMSIFKRAISLFNNIETIVPQRLYVETLKYWFSNTDAHIKLATIEHDFMVQEPTRILRADARVLKSPKHFQILLNILEFYLKALRSYQKAVKDKYLSKFRTEKDHARAHKEVSALQNGALECQYCLAVHLLLEISDEKENPCNDTTMLQIRRLSMGFIHKIFLTAPNVIFPVHYQGYPLKYIPYMVQMVPSIYVMVEYFGELIRNRCLRRRIFAIFLIANIVTTLPLPKHVQLAQLTLLVVENQMDILESHEKVLFLHKILPALKMMAMKLAFMREGIIGIIQKGIVICQSRAAINPSITIARKKPEEAAFIAAKESIQILNNCH